jgi:hypothetical protein
MTDQMHSPHTPSTSVSPELLAQIQESPVVGKTPIKSIKQAPMKKSETSNAETVHPVITVLLGFLAIAAGMLTVLVIANYARLH